MKRTLTLVMLVGLAASAQAGTAKRFYDTHGNYRGKAVAEDSGVIRFYDRGGNFQGRASSAGTTWRFYNRQGRSSGRLSD